MVASALVVKGDEEELALNINGKKRKIQRKDFDTVMSAFKLLENRAIANMYNKFEKVISEWIEFIPLSYIPEEMKKRYIYLIKDRAVKLKLKEKLLGAKLHP